MRSGSPPGGDQPFADPAILPADVVLEQRPDGVTLARSPHTLGPYPHTLTERLHQWAEQAPDRAFLARRNEAGHWQYLTYRDALTRVRSVAQALVARRLGPDRTVLIVSGNSLEHQILALAAMYVGIPYAPVAPAYSLAMREPETLRSIVDSMRPGLVFAADGGAFEKPLATVLAPDVEVVSVTAAPTLRTTPFDTLLSAPVTPAVDAAHAAVRSSTIAKVLVTSGSTGRPKGVINTHGMVTPNLEQIGTALRFLKEGPPVLCDWLPWNHTFGGNHNVGIALYYGGTLYIDDGRPVAGAMDTTIANLREIATTAYFNVPKGYEMLVPYLRADVEFRRHFFSRLRLLFYAAAGIRRETADELQQMAIETLGHPVPWVTGLGATETGPSAMFTGPLLSPVAEIGVPVVGLTLKIDRREDVVEARVKGPNVTPGYWRDEALTSAAFDEEGFYRMGDAIAPVDPADLSKGFTFQGRLTEDFKLSTGTWVRVGPLRARLLAHAGDLVQDAVITGLGRDAVGALLFPNLGACRLVSGLPASASIDDVLDSPQVRTAIAERIARYNTTFSASSTSIAHTAVLRSAPSIDAGEITDKGSINQKAVLRHRAGDVERLYAST